MKLHKNDTRTVGCVYYEEHDADMFELFEEYAIVSLSDALAGSVPQELVDYLREKLQLK